MAGKNVLWTPLILISQAFTHRLPCNLLNSQGNKIRRLTLYTSLLSSFSWHVNWVNCGCHWHNGSIRTEQLLGQWAEIRFSGKNIELPQYLAAWLANDCCSNFGKPCQQKRSCQKGWTHAFLFSRVSLITKILKLRQSFQVRSSFPRNCATPQKSYSSLSFLASYFR